jgi:cell division septation protein DedD
MSEDLGTNDEGIEQRKRVPQTSAVTRDARRLTALMNTPVSDTTADKTAKEENTRLRKSFPNNQRRNTEIISRGNINTIHSGRGLRKIGRRTVLLSGIIIIAAALGGWIYADGGNSIGNIFNTTSRDTNERNPAAITEISRRAPQIAKHDSFANDTDAIAFDNQTAKQPKQQQAAATNTTENAADRQAGRYIVQVRATPNLAEAQTSASRLRSQGLPEVAIEQTTRRGAVLYRVRFGHFNSYDEARGAAQRNGYPDSWITTQR